MNKWERWACVMLAVMMAHHLSMTELTITLTTIFILGYTYSTFKKRRN